MAFFNPYFLYPYFQLFVECFYIYRVPGDNINTMKFTFPVLLLGLISFTCTAQDLSGTWRWANEKYEGVAQIDSNTYFSEVFFKGSDVKVLEIYNYYVLDKNKLYLSEQPIEESDSRKSLVQYKVKNHENNAFILSGNLGTDSYTRKSAQAEPQRYKPYEFYIDNNLTCFDSNEMPSKAGKCLSLAGINFYNSFEDVKKLYGKPIRTGFEDENDYYSFLIDPQDKKSPILTITVKDEKIIKINLKGYKSKGAASFSSIRLGDFYSFVKQRLGEPSYKKEVKAAGDETWVYVPVPITIEFQLNKVRSITIEPFQL